VSSLILAVTAVPDNIGGKYVAGAYIVFVVLLLIYLSIMAMKLARIERDLTSVAEIAEQRKDEGAAAGATPTATAEVKP